ncbi:921_t:CDS:2 [Funneliformis geosporum]|uniref:8462_t:CDS:1 n=1 Tax=Funneliformis geosporum TaxID=1117311 RepID=A0A9W4SBB0_9GLOM|nr:8462_t:CDS:2 [Funneliformis geosporum]CAI2168445.1 921_t:CDS:2 [Funneliformis geosporum]
MGAVKRYPYPKEVWSPAGGWWSRPANWKSNTTIITAGVFVIVGIVWKISAEREWRHNKPNKWIPSMMWSKQFKNGEYKDLKFDKKSNN